MLVINSIPTAFWAEKEVDIHGGYQHPEKGCFFEISSPYNKTIPRQSVSVWDLSYSDERAANIIFREALGMPVVVAMIIDKEKGLKEESLVIKIKQAQETAVEAEAA